MNLHLVLLLGYSALLVGLGLWIGRRVKGTLADAGKYDLAVMIEARIAAGETLAGTPALSAEE